MSKTYRKEPREPMVPSSMKEPARKPRQIKLQRMQQAMRKQLTEYPQREEMQTFKPLG